MKITCDHCGLLLYEGDLLSIPDFVKMVPKCPECGWTFSANKQQVFISGRDRPSLEVFYLHESLSHLAANIRLLIGPEMGARRKPWSQIYPIDLRRNAPFLLSTAKIHSRKNY